MTRKGRYLFTSESVTEGHPDKIADQISDSILDAVMKDDPLGRVAVETLVTTGLAFIAGEISTTCYVDFPKIVRETIMDVGYTRAKYGFDYETCAVISAIQEQSPDIAQGVNRDGAGDQGMMIGYACRETDVYMPLSIVLAHKLVRKLSQVRREGLFDYLRPDGKSQVTVEYEDSKPLKVTTVVLSAQHSPAIDQNTLHEDLIESVIYTIIPESIRDKNMKIHINPTGKFEVGGPKADTGVTGRKIIVDTYGGKCSHGGGCFSGKDPTKVDRSAAYMARYVAKNIVAAGLADEVELQLAYAIGVADPVSVSANTMGTAKIPESEIVKIIRDVFPLTPKGIIECLNLRRPIYKKTAAFGHFGRDDAEFTWEALDKVPDIKRAAKL
jgi:S-adenosylmethionine synthetase